MIEALYDKLFHRGDRQNQEEKREAVPAELQPENQDQLSKKTVQAAQDDQRRNLFRL